MSQQMTITFDQANEPLANFVDKIGRALVEIDPVRYGYMEETPMRIDEYERAEYLVGPSWMCECVSFTPPHFVLHAIYSSIARHEIT